MVHGAGLLYTTLMSFPISFQGNWSVWFMGQVYYILRYCLPLSLQGYWSIWFMGQVCYILRYCLLLYLYRFTGLYGLWGRFAIYYATVFLYLYRVTGLYGSWGRFAIYYATLFSYIFTGLLVCMVHGAGLIYTALLSFPISFQGNWSVWFMGQVCYILRYCLFLYFFRVTGLYGLWGRFAIYCATVFSYIFTG